MKRFELYDMRKYSTIEHYLSAAGKYLSRDSSANYAAYSEAKGLIYLYIPKRSWASVDELDQLLSEKDFLKAHAKFQDVCKELSHCDNQPNRR